MWFEGLARSRVVIPERITVEMVNFQGPENVGNSTTSLQKLTIPLLHFAFKSFYSAFTFPFLIESLVTWHL